MISGTLSLPTAKPTEPSTARSTTCPPERTTQIEPKVWSKIASSGTRESMQPSTTACGCWPPEAAAAAAETSWPCSRPAADEPPVAGEQLGQRVGGPHDRAVGALGTGDVGRLGGGRLDPAPEWAVMATDSLRARTVRQAVRGTSRPIRPTGTSIGRSGADRA